MSSIEFLELSDVLEIHADQIFHYGGTVELRDAGLLESAIAQPRATFGGQFLHAYPFEMAAAYLFHIVNNHPFVDDPQMDRIRSAVHARSGRQSDE
jgi:death-on-curing protein